MVNTRDKSGNKKTLIPLFDTTLIPPWDNENKGVNPSGIKGIKDFRVQYIWKSRYVMEVDIYSIIYVE